MAAPADVEIKIWDSCDISVIPRFLESASVAHDIPTRSQHWFTWKFRDSPWGPSTIAYAETERGDVAGAVAFGAYRLKSHGSVIQAGVSYETFVHPDFRRRGLFGRLLDAAESSARNRGAAVLLNFPNSASRKGFLNAGWHDIGGVQTWIRPVSLIRTFRSLTSIARKGRAIVPDKPTTSLASDRLMACVADRIPVGTTSSRPDVLRREHDPDFLIWRYTTSMANRYDVVESGELSALLRLGSRGGQREAQVLEVLSQGSATPLQLCALMRSIARHTRASLLSILVTPASPLASRLPLLGFAPMPNSISFFMKPLDTVEPEARDIVISGVDIHTW